MAEEYKDFLGQVTEQAPATGPSSVPSGAGEDEYSKALGIRPPEQPTGGEYAQALGIQEKPELGIPELIGGGVQRGLQSVKAAPSVWKGIFAELEGDRPAAVQHMQTAEQIEAQAPPAVWQLQNVKDPYEFIKWLSEKFGENAINIVGAIPFAGVGGLAGQLAAKGLVSSGRIGATLNIAGKSIPATQLGATVGSGAALYPYTVGIETPQTAQEQFQVTGSPQPGISLAAGAAKGVLELYTPLSISRALFAPGMQLGKTYAGAVAKTFAKEAATELGQEAIDIEARRLNDPNYSYFKSGPFQWSDVLDPAKYGEGAWRLAEAGVAGGFIGAGIGAPAHYAERRIERRRELGTEQPGSRTTIPADIEPLGSRSQTLDTKVSGPDEHGFYRVIASEGNKPVAYINYRVLENVLRVGSMESKRPLSTIDIRSIFRQLQELHPNITSIEGVRGTGAHSRMEDPTQRVSLPQEVIADDKVTIERGEFDRRTKRQQIAVSSPFGYIEAYAEPDKKTITIASSGLEQEGEKGKGHGLALYKAVADEALKLGYTLQSDTIVSEEAGRMYDALERRGYKIERMPGSAQEDKEGKYYSSPQSQTPVFRVTQGPVTALREMVLRQPAAAEMQRPSDVLPQEALASSPRDDLLHLGPLISTSFGQPQVERFLDLLEAHTPRFIEVANPTRVWTDTELELEFATNRPQNEKPQLLRIDQSSLVPSAITAHLEDLAPVDSGRVWFTDKVAPEAKAGLLTQYIDLLKRADIAKRLGLESAEQRARKAAMLQPIYEQLLNAGLRVVPSRGAGFFYNSGLSGQPVAELKETKRTLQIALYDPMTNRITPFAADELTFRTDPAMQGMPEGSVIVALDENKIHPEDFKTLPNGLIELNKPLQIEKLTPGITLAYSNSNEELLQWPSEFQADSNTVQIADDLDKNDPAVRSLWKELNAILPIGVRILRELGIDGKLGVLLTSDRDAHGSPAWIGVDTMIIGFSPGLMHKQVISTEKDLQATVLTSFMHELGHAVTFWYYKMLSVEIQDQLMYAWKKAGLALRAGDESRTHVAATPDNAYYQQTFGRELTGAQWQSFPEWLAEQFRRWATNDQQIQSWLDKTFSQGARKLESFYAKWEKEFGAQSRANISQPDYFFSAFMQYLRDFGAQKNIFQQLMRQDALYSVEQKLLDSPTKLQMAEQVVAAIRSMMHMFPPEVQVKINEVLDPQIAMASAGAAARWIPDLNLIEMAIGAVRSEQEGKAYVAHELMHSYETLGLITPEEIELLMRDIKGRENELFPSNFRQALYNQVNRYGAARGWSTERVTAEYKAQVNRELRAYYIQRFVETGKAFSEQAATIFQRLLAVLERIRNWMNGLGYQTREDVIRAFFKGEMVSRAELRARNAEAVEWSAARNISMEAQLARGQKTQTVAEAVTGKPITLTLYHGTAQSEDPYSLRNEAVGPGPTKDLKAFARAGTKAVFYSDSPDIAELYTTAVGTANPAIFRHIISFKNPLVVDTVKSLDPQTEITTLSRAKRLGHDVVIFKNVNDFGGTQNQIAVLDESLVKLEPSMPQEAIDQRVRHSIMPEHTWQVGPNLWAAAEYFQADYATRRNAPEVLYHFYEQPEGKQLGPKPPHRSLGQLVGVLQLQNRGPRGFEVEWIQGDRFALAQTMLAEAEKDLGMRFKLPGRFTEEGMKMAEVLTRMRGQKGLTDLYVGYKEGRALEWYSPNYIRQQRAFWNNPPETLDGKPLSPATKRAQRAKWNNLYKQVPDEVWSDPRLEQMFALKRNHARDEVQGSVLRAGQQADESRLLAALGQGQATQDVFTSTFELKQKFSQAENAKASGLSFEQSAPSSLFTMEVRQSYERMTGYGESPEARKELKNTLHEADRIGKFTKWFWGLHQLTWRNEHITRLRDYLQHAEQMNQLSETWLRKADEVARIYNKANATEREAISQALFLLSEMDYRTAAEKTAKTTRMPAFWDQFLRGVPPAPGTELEVLFRKAGLDKKDYSIVRYVQKFYADFIKAASDTENSRLQRKFANSPQELQLAQAALIKQVAEITAKPYFPHMRFGEFNLSFRDPANRNKVVWSGLFQTQSQRDAARERLRPQFRNMDMTYGRVHPSAIEFASLPSFMLGAIKEQLLNAQGGPAVRAAIQAQLNYIEEFEQLHAPDRTFRKMLIPAHSIPGFSMDAFRAFRHFALNGSRYLSRLAFKDLMQDDINAVNATVTSGEVGNTAKRQAIVQYMQEHFSYIMEGGRDGGKLRAAASLWFLGFSPAAAAMNFTQIPMVLIPWLEGNFGAAKAYGTFNRTLSGLKSSFDRVQGSPAFLKARDEMINQGRIDTGQAAELASYSEGLNLLKMGAGTKVDKLWQSIPWVGMWMFGKVERFNREFSFRAAWELALENPNTPRLKEIERHFIIEIGDLQSRVGLSYDEAIAFLFAKETIDRTQFQYAKYTDPPFMRGPVRKNFLIFYKYTQSMLYALKFNSSMTHMLLLFAFVYGLSGIPFAEDGNEFIRMLAKKLFGKDIDLLQNARELVRQMTRGTVLDAVGPDLALHGISRYSFGFGLLPQHWAVPRFDASANGSMGRVVPGLAEAFHGIAMGFDKELVADAAQKAAGAGYGYIFSLLHYLQDKPSLDSKKWEALLPRAARGFVKAYRYGYDPQAETTRGGAKIVTFDPRDPDDIATVIAQAAGFTPTKVTERWELEREKNEAMKLYAARRSALYVQFDKALAEKHEGAIDDVLVAIKHYNDDVLQVDANMAIKAQELRGSLNQRRKQREMMEMLGISNRREGPVMQRLQDLYPGVKIEKVK